MTQASTIEQEAGSPQSPSAGIAERPAAASIGDDFVPRHIGPSEEDVRAMLDLLGVRSLDELIDRTVPKSIRLREPLQLDPSLSEADALAELREIATQNQVFRSYIGM